jgi:hypothetical protein
VARKDHTCDACLGIIASGDRYHRQRSIWEGEPMVYKCHALCDAVYWRMHRERELWDDESLDDSEIREGLLRVFASLSQADPERTEGT